MRDSVIDQRIQHQRNRIEMLNRQMSEPFLTLKERAYLQGERSRAQRRIAMLTEDERNPTSPTSTPGKQSSADEYRDWLKTI